MWWRLRRWWQFRKLGAQACSPDPQQRRQAAVLLASTGRAEAMPHLILLCHDPDTGVAQAAEEGLASLGRPIVELLLNLLRGNDARQAELAARLLGRIGDPRATGPLLTALKFGSHPLRLAATRSLESLPDVELPTLVAGLADGYPYVRDASEQLLLKRGPSVIPALIEALRGSDASLRRRAASVLGKAGDASAREGLTGLLDDEDAEVRQTASEALERLATPQADG